MITLRPYQEQSINNVYQEFHQGKRKTLLILPTGCGKTVVFAHIIDHFAKEGKRCLVIAHRQELIKQAKGKIYDVTGIIADIEKAEDYASMSANVVVASVQTLKGKRLFRFPKDHFDLIVIDEAHHSSADTYQNIIEYFDANILGVTATPDRADEKELGDIFESIAFQYPLIDAIKNDYLANIKGFMISDFDIDLSELKSVSGKDFTDKELESVILNYIDPIAQGIANPQIKDLKSIAFLPSVKSSELLAYTLNARGIKSRVITGETDPTIRSNILTEFTKGSFTHLINCAVLTEGFDEPSIQNIIIARPTKSRALYAQMVGRGTRKHESKSKDENGKEFVYLTEFNYTNTKHKLVDAYELFSSKGFDERVRERAKLNSKGDFLKELDEAHESIFNLDNLLKRLAIKTKDGIVYDPFAICDFFDIDLTGEFEVRYEGRLLEGRATEKQVELLKRNRILGAEKFTKAQASKVIDIIAQNGWSMENIMYKVRKKHGN